MGNSMNLFDWQFYVNKYEDLKKAGVNTKEKAKKHWEKYGKKEGRICCCTSNETNTDNFIKQFQSLQKPDIVSFFKQVK